MIFRAKDKQSVELRIVKYQFPSSGSIDDKNWLLINLIIKSKFGDWQVLDPFLQIQEIADLAIWLTDWAKGNYIRWNPLEFIEPNLSFEMIKVDDDSKILKIIFENECKPKFIDEDSDCFLDCIVSNEILLELAKSLSGELENIPKRI